MEKNIVELLLQIKNADEKEALLNLVNQEKARLVELKTEDSLVRQSIIDFVLIYNPLNKEWKNKTVSDFCIKLINYYSFGENISSPILNLMKEKFKNPSSFKVLINFEEEIKTEKAYLECYFKFILLTKNLEKLLSGIKNYLSIESELLTEQIKKMDVESPYAQILLRRLIEKLIVAEVKLKKDDIILIFNEEKAVLKKYYNFLCPQCLQILFCRYYLEKFTVMCINGHDYSKETKSSKNINSLSQFSINCKSCKANLEMYERNFTCFQCDNFFCGNCCEKHKKDCLKFKFCKHYQCGFVCREHNKDYISICSICEKNLCELCKNVHFHRVPDKDYYLINDIINNNKTIVSNEEENDEKKNILKLLISSYKFFENFFVVPYFFRQSIYFSVNDKYLIINESDFFFKSFYNNEFIAYYSKLIEQMKNGNMNAINIMKEIKVKYQNHKLKICKNFNDELSFCMNNAMANTSQMMYHIVDLNERFNSLNENIKDIKLNHGHIFKLETNINKLETKVELYKANIFSLLKSANKYKLGLKLLFDRHLADLIIRILLKEYHSSFQPIKLDLKICQELMNYFKNDIEKGVDLYNKIKNKINSEQPEEVKNDIELNDISNYDNKIQFDKSIRKNNISINPTELNFILELFFYIKSKGNQIGHPNIDPDNSIKLKCEEKNFNKVENILNIDDIPEIKDKSEEKIRKIINDKVTKKMNDIRDEIINYFTDPPTKKELKK